MKLKSVNPYSSKVIAEYDVYTDQETNEIVAQAHQGFLENRERSVHSRALLMQSVSETLLANKYEYANLISDEMGKLLTEALAEVEKSALVCQFYADNSGTFLTSKPILTEYKKSIVCYQPLGVVLAVMPWNFPFWQVFRFAAPTLMAGNSAILKHASNVSGCSLLIQKIFSSCKWGNAFHSVLCSSSKVEGIIRNDKVRAVSLTGSEYAGSQVASVCGEQIKKSVLELGGSDAFIVWSDADVLESVKSGVLSRFLNSGQSCIGAKRFIIEKSLYEEFKRLLLEKMSLLTLGDPKKNTTRLAPLAGEEHAKVLAYQITTARENGALLTGGDQMSATSFAPGVLENISLNNPIRLQELFGPIAQLYCVSSREEAVEIANETPFGLAASVWTKNQELQSYFIQQLDAGSVFVNSMVKSDPRLPFGGVKKSGFGRELAEVGIKEFVNVKTVVVD